MIPRFWNWLLSWLPCYHEWQLAGGTSAYNWYRHCTRCYKKQRYVRDLSRFSGGWWVDDDGRDGRDVV